MQKDQSLTTAQVLELRQWISTGRAHRVRVEAEITRATMARELGVSESALWRWEHGERYPRGLCAAGYYRLLAQLEPVTAGRIGGGPDVAA